jgi:hypothetical protein
MSKIPNLPYEKVIAALRRDGWVVVRQRLPCLCRLIRGSFPLRRSGVTTGVLRCSEYSVYNRGVSTEGGVCERQPVRR